MSTEPIKLNDESLRLIYLPGGYSRKGEKTFLLFATRYDLDLYDIEFVKQGFDRKLLEGVIYSENNNFEAWFYDHCMLRMVRPVGAMEEFIQSRDAEIRGIAIKALRDRYGVTEADRLSAQMAKVNVSISNYTLWTMIATVLSAIVSLVSCVSALCKLNR